MIKEKTIINCIKKYYIWDWTFFPITRLFIYIDMFGSLTPNSTIYGWFQPYFFYLDNEQLIFLHNIVSLNSCD